MLSSFGDNINLENLDPNMLGSLIQYTSFLKNAKEVQNNENVMENFLSQLNPSKTTETQKEENKPYMKNQESNSNIKETINKSNEKSAINEEINNFNKLSNLKSNQLNKFFNIIFSLKKI